MLSHYLKTASIRLFFSGLNVNHQAPYNTPLVFRIRYKRPGDFLLNDYIDNKILNMKKQLIKDRPLARNITLETDNLAKQIVDIEARINEILKNSKIW